MHYRLSLDTFYFGLSVDDYEVNEFIKEIKNSLFFLSKMEPSNRFCRNRFYQYEMVSEDFGFYMFLLPKKSCKNDMITIQLGGKFFKNIKLSRKFINWIYDRYYGLIEYQRVDVALDCIYNENDVKNGLDENFTNSMGFPVPSYSKEWKNRQIAFETYGRIYKDYKYINMIASGKDDYRIRVYNKTLDLTEKYNTTYDSYYGIKQKDSALVYRIESQVRSDKLKVFCDNCNLDDKTRIFDYDSLCYNFMYYMLYKYDFLYIDKKYLLGNDFYISNMNIKTESTLEGRKEYNKKMMFSYYKKYCDNCDELEYIKKEDLRLRNIFKKVKLKEECEKISSEIEDDKVNNYPLYKNYADLINMDLSSEVLKNEDVPF